MNTNSEDDKPATSIPLGSRAELERALDTRTHPSKEDAAGIAALEGLDLRQAVYRAGDALAVFDDVLLQLQDDSFELGEALAGMDAEALRADNGWSEALHLLAGLPEDGDELRAVGLVKYRRYLRNRLEALEQRQKELSASSTRRVPAPEAAFALDPDLELDLATERDQAEATDEQESGAHLVLDLELMPDDVGNRAGGDFGQATVMHTPEPLQDAVRREARPGTDSASHGAVADAARPPPGPPERLLRLHRGKPVGLAVAGRDEVELWLARSRFRLLLSAAGGPRLISDHGDCGSLRNGRSLIGRSPDCEIVIDSRHDTVSRVHLEVEVEHGLLVAVTDLSSGGTYVRPEMVPRRTDAA